MATKGDLVQAQSFSRRRLLTAFTSGAPGGKELEPAKPLRAVVAAAALAVGVILVGVFWGLINPGLPQGWENGRLVLAQDTGARYVSVKGTLHPVVNTASARLLIPSSSFAVVSTDQQSLAGVDVGSTVGIVGAPDTLPAPQSLVNTGWTACVTDDARLSTRIAATPDASATDDAVVVTSGGALFIIAGHTRFPVASADSDAVLRAAGITASAPRAVPASWVNLFDAGSDLAPLSVPAGAPIPGTELSAGEVVHIAGSPDDERFLVTAKGELAALSPMAWQLYQLGDGPSAHAATEVQAAQVRGLPTSATPAGGPDWPADGFAPLGEDQRACALLQTSDAGPQTVLATQTPSTAAAGVQIAPSAGALVAAGAGADSSTMLTLVDGTGTAYTLPGATDETIKRLGYAPGDVGEATAAWTALLPAGPALTTEAAGKTPTP